MLESKVVGGGFAETRLAIFGFWADDSKNIIFAFYGLIMCNLHLCATQGEENQP